MKEVEERINICHECLELIGECWVWEASVLVPRCEVCGVRDAIYSAELNNEAREKLKNLVPLAKIKVGDTGHIYGLSFIVVETPFLDFILNPPDVPLLREIGMSDKPFSLFDKPSKWI